MSTPNFTTVPMGKTTGAGVFLVCALILALWGSPPVALLAGILFALVVRHPYIRASRTAAKWLLQGAVVLLGFGMDLPAVLRLGRDGALFAALTIGATLAAGGWLGPRLRLDRTTNSLIAVGTAICGGSAIAAASSVMVASEAQIAVSLGTVFLLNAAALVVFPIVGHWLHLTQGQFGLWAGVAIHDISSVVGAGLSYGPAAVATATAVKLSRTLWIVPVTLVIALRDRAQGARARGDLRAAPWFIGLFLAASLLRSTVPAMVPALPVIAAVARHGMVLVLFLIGTALSASAIRSVGWRAISAGLILWAFIGVGSLAVILGLHLGR